MEKRGKRERISPKCVTEGVDEDPFQKNPRHYREYVISTWEMAPNGGQVCQVRTNRPPESSRGRQQKDKGEGETDLRGS